MILAYLADYAKSLFYKPCFGGIKSNFLNKRFKSLSDSLNLKVYMPVTWLIEAKSLNFFKYKKIRYIKYLFNIFQFFNFKSIIDFFFQN